MKQLLMKMLDAVPRCVLDQIRWERDVAMAQLEEIGVAFCEKTDDVVRVVRCKECIYSKPNNGLLVEGARFCTATYCGALKEHPVVWDMDYCSDGRKEVKDNA